MSLSDWANNGWLRKHSTSKQEIKQLLEIVERDLKDAQQRGVSADWRFGMYPGTELPYCFNNLSDIFREMFPEKVRHTSGCAELKCLYVQV